MISKISQDLLHLSAGMKFFAFIVRPLLFKLDINARK